jgi:hypothetical protein
MVPGRETATPQDIGAFSLCPNWITEPLGVTLEQQDK